VLSRLFRRRFLEELQAVHRSGRLQFFGEHAALADAQVFAEWLAPLRRCEWVVYAKRPFAGPEAVLAYLSRYTHRVAIANSRLLAMDEHAVTFGWKDYRAKGRTRHKTMTLGADEFMRRFLLPALRRRDARPSDLRARADDPRATPTAARTVSAIVCTAPTLRRLHRPEPTRHDLALRAIPVVVARDIDGAHAQSAAMPGSTATTPFDGRGGLPPSSRARPPKSP
jgi:hypothetical protein